MKAIRKSDGKVIEVREWFSGSDSLYSDPDMNCFYQASDLDFNVDKEVTIDGWVARDKCGDIFLYGNKPIRKNRVWIDNAWPILRLLQKESFPSLTWESEPFEVTVTVKPKKQ